MVQTTLKMKDENHKRLRIISAMTGKTKIFILNKLIESLLRKKSEESDDQFIERIKKEYDL